MDKLYVIKIGGNVIDDEKKLSSFLQSFANVPGKKILVHGGGKLATRMAEQLGIEQQMVNGRRITDAATLRIVTMVYAGLINKNIVAQLQALGCNAIGLTGADGNAIAAHKRVHATTDYGFVGDVDAVNSSLLAMLLHHNTDVILAPVTHDGKGQLLNTNADTIAQETARALSGLFDVSLVYTFEKDGVLRDVNDAASVIPVIHPGSYRKLLEEGAIHSGMIPKLDNAFAALQSGVTKVIIGNSEALPQLLNGNAGTTIQYEA